ncbi:MAG TPA: hypothetical protein DEA90_06935, partial [Opitutae bacterium]|nr:hypothetical protein [Opitutae bacterium]
MKLRTAHASWLVASLSVFSALCALDVNNDQMSDVYVAHYGLAAGSGEEDPDGDLQNNYIESVWGTDPLDGTSVFSPSSIQVTSSLFDFS